MSKTIIFYIVSAVLACAIFLASRISVDKGRKADELSHPEIFKNIKLGYDISSVNDSLEKNGGCEYIPYPEYSCKYEIEFRFPMPPLLKQSSKECQYLVETDIYAKPQFFYQMYNGVKVLSSACLIYHSPTKFPEISLAEDIGQPISANEFKKSKILYGIPAVNKMQVDRIISIYDSKYGSRSSNGHFTEYTWEEDDLLINLYVYQYGKEITFNEGEIEQTDAYQVIVLYSYNKKMRSLFEQTKNTQEGEVIGDKI
jgi:hypothetical protein